MIHPLAEFARALRQAGVAVSPAEVLDAGAAVRAIGVDDPEHFRLALRAVLAKSPAARETFDQLYPAWFSVPWPRPVAGKKRKGRTAKPATEGQQSSGGHGLAPQRAPQTEPRDRGARPAPTAETSADDRFGDAHREAQLARHAATARAGVEQERRRREAVGHRPLQRRPTAMELAGLDREVARLGRWLRTRYGRRRQPSAHGRPDLRRTVAAAMRTGGVPFRIIRHRPRLARPRLLVLCDVSGSAVHAARFLWRLLHETHRLFDRTDGFVFVDQPIPAGPLLRRREFEAAWAELDHLPGLDLRAFSDFGHLFWKLLDDHAALLTRRTSVLVFGDARCNRFDPQAWALSEIARRVHRVIWLNPERQARWYTQDSRLADYEPDLDALLPAETLAEMAAAVARVVAPGYRRG